MEWMMPEIASRDEEVLEDVPEGHRNRRIVISASVIVLVILAGAGLASAWKAGVFNTGDGSGGNQGAPPPATATVESGDVTATTQENGTLGYENNYTIHGAGPNGGAPITWLPSQGQVINQGQILYKTGQDVPIILMYGNTPDWRPLSEGVTGDDVTELNHDLVNLGYANESDITSLGWDYYSWETNYAIQKLEEHFGVCNPSGNLDLGDIVFEPQAIRVTTLIGGLGLRGLGPVLAATSDVHHITVELNTSQESQVKAGDPVTVTLPDGTTTTDGVIASVGKVASGSGSNATIPVYVNLKHPAAAGDFDQAPVTVNITNASANNVLVVPVSALLAQPNGGYEVEVVGANNSRRQVAVTPGVFDDASGTVSVTGDLTPGQKVVVPSS
jgi:multidrug efflux pump subunit AcrA (membrane-fusion protein)